MRIETSEILLHNIVVDMHVIRVELFPEQYLVNLKREMASPNVKPATSPFTYQVHCKEPEVITRS